MPMAHTHHNKTVEEYRQLADRCRQTAHMVSAENDRSRLLEMARTWDLIAERVGRSRKCLRLPAHIVKNATQRAT
jgi:hypothetical protein